MCPLFSILLFSTTVLSVAGFGINPSTSRDTKSSSSKNHTVLILGGGVAGIIAARTLYEQGIRDFLIIEARSELGGRLKSHNFSGVTVEAGANWVQGTQEGNGPANPIFTLAKKWGVKTQFNDFSGGSLSKGLLAYLCRDNVYSYF